MPTTPIEIFYDRAMSVSGTNATLDSAGKATAGIFYCPKAGTITAIGAVANSVTTPPAFEVTLQGINSSRTPDGTKLNADLPTWTPVQDTWAWTTIADVSVSAMQSVAGVITYPAAGSGSARFQQGSSTTQFQVPYTAFYNGSSWSMTRELPTIAIRYSDGTIITPCSLSQNSTTSYSSATNPNERSSVWVQPFTAILRAVRVLGSLANASTSTSTINLYQGTSTTALATITPDPKVLANLNDGQRMSFPMTYTLSAGATYRLGWKATGAGNIGCGFGTYSSTSERDASVGPIWSDSRNGSSWIGEVTTRSNWIVPIFGSVSVGGRRPRGRYIGA